MRTAAQLFVECLENEGVRHVFGIPGEETLDLNEALDHSGSVSFIPVRHEQGAAFMADAYGRLTGHAGVCLGTLGPGATNLVTGLADAFLDRAPVVALTGQTGLLEMHKESHQYIDVVRMMKPVTKWNARIHDARSFPRPCARRSRWPSGRSPGPPTWSCRPTSWSRRSRAGPCPAGRRRWSSPWPASCIGPPSFCRAPSGP